MPQNILFKMSGNQSEPDTEELSHETVNQDVIFIPSASTGAKDSGMFQILHF